MSTQLSNMTLSELWELFPIVIEPHNEFWKTYYEEFEAALKGCLKGFKIKEINHIGSTAVKGIWSKPIIDILVEIAPEENMENVAKALENNGFIIMSRDENKISLNRGYTINGFAEKVCHVHLRFSGDNNELYFRNYLNANPHIAKEYEKLKLQLCKQYEYNRDAYTEAKTKFVNKWTAVAKEIAEKEFKSLEERFRKVLPKEKAQEPLCAIINPFFKPNSDVLVVGMNPSGSGNVFDMHVFADCHSDFWNPLHEMLGEFDAEAGYIDLLPIRGGNQNSISNRDSNLRGSLIGITQQYIEKMQPKLIILANLSAQFYFGLNERIWQKGIWMGYQGEKIFKENHPLEGAKKRWDLYRITGLRDETDNNKNHRINFKIIDKTNLANTYILFYRQHKAHGNVVKDEEKITANDIKKLLDYRNGPQL